MPSKVHPLFRPPTYLWDDIMSMQKGHLIRNQSVQVNWNPGYFHRAGPVRAGTQETITTTIDGDHDGSSFLGPYVDGDPGTELICTRTCCYLLAPKYVPLFIRAPVEARRAWTTLYGALLADGNAAACLPLIHFLQAALTLTFIGVALHEIAAMPPTVPVIDAHLINHHLSILHEDIPVLNQHGQVIQATQIAVSIGFGARVPGDSSLETLALKR